MTKKQVRPIGDFLGFPPGCEESVPFEEVLGRELVIETLVPFVGSFGPMVFLFCRDGDSEVVVRTGSGVVLDQLERVKEEFPLLAEFALVKNYYLLR